MFRKGRAILREKRRVRLLKLRRDARRCEANAGNQGTEKCIIQAIETRRARQEARVAASSKQAARSIPKDSLGGFFVEDDDEVVEESHKVSHLQELGFTLAICCLLI